MKKLLLFLALSLLSVSCNKYIVSNIYEQRYETKELAVSDVYKQIKTYKIDSIPLEQWQANVAMFDTIVINQNTLRKQVDKKTNYQFVLSMFSYPTSSYFTFLIRYRGKK